MSEDTALVKLPAPIVARWWSFIRRASARYRPVAATEATLTHDKRGAP